MASFLDAYTSIFDLVFFKWAQGSSPADWQRFAAILGIACLIFLGFLALSRQREPSSRPGEPETELASIWLACSFFCFACSMFAAPRPFLYATFWPGLGFVYAFISIILRVSVVRGQKK